MRKARAASFLAILGLATLPLLANPAAWARGWGLHGPSSGGSNLRHVEGELIVKFRSGTSAATHRRAHRNHGGQALATLSGDGLLHHIRAQAGQSTADAVAEYRNDPAVEYAQPNYVYHATAVPNDPGFPQLWGLHNTGQTIPSAGYPDANPGTSGNDMNLESAWNVITDCSSVIVAVVDSGVNYNQSDLATNMWNGGASFPKHGYNFVDNNNDPMDKAGHGTHVAGTIAAVGNNGVGTTGVCWKAQIMAVRVMDATGSGTTANIVSGINFAVTNGAKVINMSLGGGSYDAASDAAIANANAHNVVVVVAAGNSASDNDGSTPTYPCNYTQPNLVCVAALDQAYGLASFSNFGKTSVDVGAPGTNILSTYAGVNSSLTDTFNSSGTLNWTVSGGGWNYALKLFHFSDGTSSLIDLLTSPSNWNGTATYGNNLNAKVFKSFNLTSDAAILDFGAFVDTQSGADFFNISCHASGTDPFAGGGVSLDTLSGSTQGSAESFEYDLNGCQTATTSIGFQLTTNSSVVGTGVAILDFQVSMLTLNNTSYELLDGTSMATPHVAGLATMLAAYHPSYTAADIVEAIKNGGRTTQALCGKTTTGRAADAFGSLTYIRAPAGVTAVAQ